MGEETSGLAVPWFRSLRSNLCPHFSGFLLDHSGALLQVPDVFLDPAVSRIDTDVSALSGEEDDTRFGAVAAGLKIVNHISLGDFPGGVGEAASGWGVNLFLCTGAEGHSAEDKDSSHEDLHDAGQAGRRLWAELRRGLGTHFCLSPSGM